MEKNLRFLIALWISKAAMFLQKLLGRFELPTSSLPRMRSTY